jgi:ABC-type amino acid transport substrate-binding protein
MVWNRLRLCRRLLSGALACLMGMSAHAGDLADLQARGELRHLGVTYANFVTGAGDGLDVELMQGFAKQLGVRYRLVPAHFDTVVRDLLGQQAVPQGERVSLQGQFPVRGDVIAAGFTILPWRARVMLLSAPTFPTQVLLVASAGSRSQPVPQSADVHADIARTKALIGRHSLLVMPGTSLDPALYGLNGKGLVLRPYTRSSNLNELVPALLQGDADFSLLDMSSAVLDLDKWAGQIKILGPVSPPQTTAAAFAPSSPELRQAFNDYLAQLRADGRYDALVARYYPGIQRSFPAFFARPR